MNKQETVVVVLLAACLVAWFMLQPKPTPVPAGARPAVAAPETLPADAALADGASKPADRGDQENSAPVQQPVPQATAPAVAEPPPATPPETVTTPDTRFVLTNAHAEIEVGSRYGAVVRATLKDFRARNVVDSEPMTLQFERQPGLALQAQADGRPLLTGFTAGETTPTSVVFEATLGANVRLTRAIRLGPSYSMEVVDHWVNLASNVVSLPALVTQLGPMPALASHIAASGPTYLGIDSLEELGGDGVKHHGKDLPKLFGESGGMFGCFGPRHTVLEDRVEQRLGASPSWVAPKNQFFVQILRVDGGADDGIYSATRDTTNKVLKIDAVAAGLCFNERSLDPGAEHVQRYEYYVGPKKHAELKKLGEHRHRVMEFGMFNWFRGLCGLLLQTLNGLYSLVPNYGVAIILLTVIVKVLFWPVTHKSTESMKRMQELQPEIKALQAKYKDNQQRLHQEMMKLYKEKRVNPMSGCLPMLVQIPVFIALYTVLRSAVELRFADFLWVRDLSEPEMLLAGMVPLVPTNSLNILPLFMAATMVLQQHLTPTSGDPQQKKMMMIMSVLFLFMFYGMASALVLYWSVSQVLSIVQLLHQRKPRRGGPQVVVTRPAGEGLARQAAAVQAKKKHRRHK